MKLFISGDWGTTHLRLRLVDMDGQEVMGEVKSTRGIFANPGHQPGVSFHQAILRDEMDRLQAQVNLSLQDLPLILSGMASSSIGMMELPYRSLPVDTTGADLYRVTIPASDDFKHPIILVSGLRIDDDVMRGEETQLIGCLTPDDSCLTSHGSGERIFIFPGTHSKHVRVKNGRVLDFSTYMTGEFFHLLSTKSILAGSLTPPPMASDLLHGPAAHAFASGVMESRHHSLLHNVFLVRTHHLLHNRPKEDNYFYLSGLLIGDELKHLVCPAPTAAQDSPTAPMSMPALVSIICAGPLAQLYQTAFQHLANACVDIRDADLALVRGHCRLLSLPEE